MAKRLQKTNDKYLLSLAWMGFCSSSATVMVFTILPSFLCDVLGSSKTTVGLIEGLAIFISFVAKFASGILSDKWSTRRPFIVLGTFLGILVKILFIAASSIGFVFFAKVIDRLSKGIRAAPCEALVADISSHSERGQSYGLKYGFYALGTVTGGLLAMCLMWASQNNYRLVFAASILPSLASFLIAFFILQDQPKEQMLKKTHDWQWQHVLNMPPSFWRLLIGLFFLMLARFSEAFLTIHAKCLGWSVALLPLLMVAYDLLNAATAFAFGKTADRYDKKPLLLISVLILLISNLVLLIGHTYFGLIISMLLTGIHMGMTQCLISSMIIENINKHLRGTAFALYYATVGCAVLIGNLVAGSLTDALNSTAAPFIGGALFSAMSIVYLYYTITKGQK